jgi:hypothetical protein
MTTAVAMLAVVWMPAVASSAATIHVSPSGSDSAAGTEQAPLASVQAAVDRATPGDTILLHDGVFVCDRTILLSGSGTPEQPLRLLAASAARPVLCFEPLRRSDEEAERVGSRGILLSGDHAAVDRWRDAQRIERTRERRPDLLQNSPLAEAQPLPAANNNKPAAQVARANRSHASGEVGGLLGQTAPEGA